MPKNNMRSIIQKPESNLPSNMHRVDASKLLKIPILDRLYEIDGEWYYQIQGDPTPRKWKDYDHMDFN